MLKISSLIPILSIFILVCGSCKSDDHQNWKHGVASVFDADSVAKASKVRYNIAGKEYEETIDGWYSNVVVGEKYGMLYDTSAPGHIQIEFWNPVFEEGEQTLFFRGKIKKIEPKSVFHAAPAVVYKFKCGKEPVVEKWVNLPEDYASKYPDLHEGQYFNVQVSTENINRAVLRLDLPIASLPSGTPIHHSQPLK